MHLTNATRRLAEDLFARAMTSLSCTNHFDRSEDAPSYEAKQTSEHSIHLGIMKPDDIRSLAADAIESASLFESEWQRALSEEHGEALSSEAKQCVDSKRVHAET